MTLIVCFLLAMVFSAGVFLLSMSRLEKKVARLMETFVYMQGRRLRTMRYIARLQCGHVQPPPGPEEKSAPDPQREAVLAHLGDPSVGLSPPEADHIFGMWEVVMGRRPGTKKKVAEYTRRLLDLGVPIS